jgi:hypothetical protein
VQADGRRGPIPADVTQVVHRQSPAYAWPLI